MLYGLTLPFLPTIFQANENQATLFCTVGGDGFSLVTHSDILSSKWGTWNEGGMTILRKRIRTQIFSRYYDSFKLLE